MTTKPAATVRMFASLHSWRKSRGMNPATEVNIPGEGCSAVDLACQLDLPLEKIEAVFVNHRVCGLNQTIRSGDRVAFVPTCIPSPERLMLGIYRAGLQSPE